MYLNWLHLRHFRNYQDQQIKFTAQKTILVGNNAQGKSNLLEAVEILATLKSHRVARDRELVQNEAKLAQVEAQIERKYGTASVKFHLRKQGRRSIWLNGENIRRQIDFLGTLNAVQFSSLDLELVRGSPETRRSWLDGILVQLEPVYANILQQYGQILRQRNALLKQSSQQHQQQSLGLKVASDSDTTYQLNLWNEQLAALGTKIIRRRIRVLERLTPIAQTWHNNISAKTETLQINYQPNIESAQSTAEAIEQAFLEKIAQRQLVEQVQGRTVVGPHRDEIEFTINQTPARYYGSQGQQRTLVLALKLAELNLIEQVVGDAPLLLLDDVLAELDPQRQNQLLEVIGDRTQSIITTTHIDAFDAGWLKASQILTVKAGQLEPQF